MAPFFRRVGRLLSGRVYTRNNASGIFFRGANVSTPCLLLGILYLGCVLHSSKELRGVLARMPAKAGSVSIRPRGKAIEYIFCAHR
jgi:hypothetical protein